MQIVSDYSWFPLCLRSGLGAACQRSGILRIPIMLVKSPSAPTCPGAHDPTSPQSFPMTFTKFSKSPKPLKISDNTAGRTDSATTLLFFPLFFFCLFCFLQVLISHCHCCFLLKPPRLPLFAVLWFVERWTRQNSLRWVSTRGALMVLSIKGTPCSPHFANHPYCCVFVIQQRSHHVLLVPKWKPKGFVALHLVCCFGSVL